LPDALKADVIRDAWLDQGSPYETPDETAPVRAPTVSSSSKNQLQKELEQLTQLWGRTGASPADEDEGESDSEPSDDEAGPSQARGPRVGFGPPAGSAKKSVSFGPSLQTAVPPPTTPNDPVLMQTAVLMEIMKQLQGLRRKPEGDNGFDDDCDDGYSTTASRRKFGAVRQMRERHLKDPMKLLASFDREIMDELGVEVGGHWTYRDWSRRIGFGHMKGLNRCHAHFGDVLAALKKNDKGMAIVVCVQAMKCLHQVLLDQGDWRTGVLYMPTPDPLSRKVFGGLEEEAETIATYRKALADLKKSETAAGFPSSNRTSQNEDPEGGKETNRKFNKKAKGGNGGGTGGDGK
jgi:hypothetical protein